MDRRKNQNLYHAINNNTNDDGLWRWYHVVSRVEVTNISNITVKELDESKKNNQKLKKQRWAKKTRVTVEKTKKTRVMRVTVDEIIWKGNGHKSEEFLLTIRSS